MKKIVDNKNNKEYEIHPLCGLFPWMDEETLESLRIDLKEYGQRDTIKLFQGQVLDGKNRLRACVDLGLEPKFEELPDDTNPTAYVRALGLNRRDLTPLQRIEIAQELMKYEQEQLSTEEKEKIEKVKDKPIIKRMKIERLMKEANTNKATVKKVLKIQEKAKNDEKAKKAVREIIQNKKTITQVYNEVVGEVKRTRAPLQGPTKAEIRQDLLLNKTELAQARLMVDKLIEFIKEKGLWDEIKGDFNIKTEKNAVIYTIKELREAGQV